MMNVSRQQPAKIVGVFTRSAAAAFVKQKANSIHILEQAPRSCAGARAAFWQSEVIQFPLAIQFGQFGNLVTIKLRSSEPQFFFECLLQDLDVLVLAENEWHHEPIIS